MITITNGILTAEIAELGAELQSLKKGSAEYLWNGDAKYWTGRAPIMFPICGGVADDEYEYCGKKYKLGKHGFARKRVFAIESATESSATLLLAADGETLKSYPFEFELRVRFTIIGETLAVDYIVTNAGGELMPFSVGAHEAYACPEGIGDYELKFEQTESLCASVLHGNLLGHDTIPVLEGDTLSLDPEFFSVDALVFTDIKSRAATLRNCSTGRGVAVRFDNFPYLLVWQKYSAPYICVEPWCGLPDFTDSTGKLVDKAGIIIAAPGETVVRTHTIRPL